MSEQDLAAEFKGDEKAKWKELARRGQKIAEARTGAESNGAREQGSRFENICPASWGVQPAGGGSEIRQFRRCCAEVLIGTMRRNRRLEQNWRSGLRRKKIR